MIPILNLRTLDALPLGALYIGRACPARGLRASPYANPFRLDNPRNATARRRVLNQYAEWFDQQVEDPVFRALFLADVGAAIALACWCYPKPCHGGHLLRRYEELRSRLVRTQ